MREEQTKQNPIWKGKFEKEFLFRHENLKYAFIYQTFKIHKYVPVKYVVSCILFLSNFEGTYDENKNSRNKFLPR